MGAGREDWHGNIEANQAKEFSQDSSCSACANFDSLILTLTIHIKRDSYDEVLPLHFQIFPKYSKNFKFQTGTASTASRITELSNTPLLPRHHSSLFSVSEDLMGAQPVPDFFSNSIVLL